jgi:hypothetical protein
MGGPLRSALAASLIWIPFGLGASAHSSAQGTAQEAAPGTELSTPVVVPQQVRYAGKIADRTGATVEAEFRIYAAQEGGERLWTETQQVTVGQDGSYTVLLGSASPGGLPQSVFAGGAARWLGVSVERGQELDRALLSSVPYAMKSADAESLAGHAAADFVTQAQLATLTLQAAPGTETTAHPETAIAGSGSTGKIPLWTSSSKLGSSEITQTGTGSDINIGINVAAPATTLDVGGATTLAGNVTLPASSKATATAGFNSPLLELGGSAYSSTSKAAVAQNFAWQTQASGNDTTAPTADLVLLHGAGTAAPTSTGLSIAPNGSIKFSPSQVFPGTGTGDGTITGITTSSPLTGSGTSGSVALGLNSSELETTLNGKYAQLGASNAFTGADVFNGGLTAKTSAGYGVSASTSSGTGIYGSTGGGGSGVEGVLTSPFEQEAGVVGVAAETSVTGDEFNIYSGVWGDTGTSGATVAPAWSIGVLGTADDGHAGVFLNNSSGFSTLYVENYGTGVTGLFKTLMASSSDGTCGVGSGGSLSCTGQIKTLVDASEGARKVETYAVQSPENWMEDFGSGELKNGVAVITIDPAFAETVSSDNTYHVFITPNGDSRGLYVIAKTATTFEVRESGGGTSSLTFDYRIVAKRRGYEKQRLVDVTERFNAERKANTIARISGVRARPAPLAKSPLLAAPGLHPGVTRRPAAIIKPGEQQGGSTQH